MAVEDEEGAYLWTDKLNGRGRVASSLPIISGIISGTMSRVGRSGVNINYRKLLLLLMHRADDRAGIMNTSISFPPLPLPTEKSGGWE